DVMDFTYRSAHVTAVAGKALARHHYGQPPSKSYFMGCSGGGMQAMRQAQSFPTEFDGIVAGGPALDMMSYGTSWLWNIRAFAGPDGKPLLTQSDLETLHRAVVEKCDMNDGIKDGLIGDPHMCRFQPSEIQCTAGKTAACLTAAQVEAVRKV